MSVKCPFCLVISSSRLTSPSTTQETQVTTITPLNLVSHFHSCFHVHSFPKVMSSGNASEPERGRTFHLVELHYFYFMILTHNTVVELWILSFSPPLVQCGAELLFPTQTFRLSMAPFPLKSR